MFSDNDRGASTHGSPTGQEPIPPAVVDAVESTVPKIHVELVPDLSGGNAKPPVVVATSGPEAARTQPAGVTPSGQDLAKVIFDRPGTQCFRDEFGFLFLAVPVAEPIAHIETLRLSQKSKPAKRWVRKTLSTILGKAVDRQLITETLAVLEELAEETTRPLANRFAKSGDSLIVDVGNAAWEEVHLSAAGWQVCPNTEPRFRRHGHQLPLPTPVRDGELNQLFEFIPGVKDDDRLLLLPWLVMACDPTVIKPILMNIGPPGSAKTTQTSMLRSLLDPSITGPLGEIDRRSMLQVMLHHAVPCFDNLGHFGRREADFFCRAITGTGIEQRRLFSDLDEVIFTFRRPIILNGIGLPTTRADFLDRCIIFHAERLTSFGSESDLKVRFEQARPKLFGSLLDLTSRTIGALASPNTNEQFRMADYVRYGRAVVTVLGRQPQEFDAAYRRNLHGHIDDAVSDDPLAQIVIKFVGDDELLGTAQEILDKLAAFAKRTGMKIDSRSKGWPQSGRWFSTRLDEIVPLLATKNIFIRRMRTNTARRIRIWQDNHSPATP